MELRNDKKVPILLASISCLLIFLLILISIVLYTLYPYAAGKNTTKEIFELFTTNPVAGYVSIDLGFYVINLLYIFVYLGLFITTKDHKPNMSLLALILGLVSIVALISCRDIVEVIDLSLKYSTEVNESQRVNYITSGDNILLGFHGTAWHVSIILNCLSIIISSSLITNEKTKIKKSIGILGIIVGLIGCLFWIPVIGLISLFLGMIISLVWLLLLGINLYKVRKET